MALWGVRETSKNKIENMITQKRGYNLHVVVAVVVAVVAVVAVVVVVVVVVVLLLAASFRAGILRAGCTTAGLAKSWSQISKWYFREILSPLFPSAFPQQVRANAKGGRKERGPYRGRTHDFPRRNQAGVGGQVRHFARTDAQHDCSASCTERVHCALSLNKRLIRT